MADKSANSKAGYHQFKDGNGVSHGSCEIFWDDCDMPEAGSYDMEGNAPTPGWYWWPCFPGCMPDGEAIGPFETSEAAYADLDNV